MSERQNKSSGGLSASSASGSSRRRSGSRSKEDFAKFQDYKRTLSRSASQSGSKSQSGSSKSSRKAGSKKTRTKSACQSGSKPHSGSIKSSTRSGVKTPRAKAESVSIQVKSSPKMVKNTIRSRRPKANQGCWTRFQKNTQIRYKIGTGAFYAIVVTVALFILGAVGFLGWHIFKKRSTQSGKSGVNHLLLSQSKNRGAASTQGASLESLLEGKMNAQDSYRLRHQASEFSPSSSPKQSETSNVNVPTGLTWEEATTRLAPKWNTPASETPKWNTPASETHANDPTPGLEQDDSPEIPGRPVKMYSKKAWKKLHRNKAANERFRLHPELRKRDKAADERFRLKEQQRIALGIRVNKPGHEYGDEIPLNMALYETSKVMNYVRPTGGTWDKF